MKLWKSYIARQNKDYTRIRYPNEFDAGMVVVIPCYDEPGLIETLLNLALCHRPSVNVLVAVVVNSSVLANQQAVAQNRTTFNEVESFAKRYDDTGITFFPLLFEKLPRKHAGVGLARKIGMDLAVEHFLNNGTEDGVIVSLDADCTVSPNFLTSIYQSFQQDSWLCVTLHEVSHRVESLENHLEDSIRQYEQYLEYYSSMLKYIGFPYFYRTIGSAFAVSADAYVKVGGMGRQQGGEDFYFLQKVFELGKTKELKKTVVYPLARYSSRVPFGTGPALEKMRLQEEGVLHVYSIRSFMELKKLFDLVDDFFKIDIEKAEAMIEALHPALKIYFEDIGLKDMIDDCNRNSSRLETFKKRFFHHFNAFRIIKYLNSVHPDPFSYEHIVSAFEGSCGCKE